MDTSILANHEIISIEDERKKCNNQNILSIAQPLLLDYFGYMYYQLTVENECVNPNFVFNQDVNIANNNLSSSIITSSLDIDINYSTCDDSLSCPFCVGTMIEHKRLVNRVGIMHLWLYHSETNTIDLLVLWNYQNSLYTFENLPGDAVHQHKKSKK